MELSVERLDASRRSDFFRVHCPENGEGWCNCVAWWVPSWEGWEVRTAEQNRELRDDLFDRGEYDGYLLYADGAPVGWCQCGPRDRLSKLRGSFDLPPDPEVWAVTCFVMAPSARGRGLSRRLLAGVIDDLRARGIRRLQGYPVPGKELAPGEAWMGPEALFRRTGFRRTDDGRTWEIEL